MKKLQKMGYKTSYLKMMNDPKFSHVRFTLDELLWLESLVNKQIKNSLGISCITRVQPQVVGCAIFFKGGCSPVCKENGIIVHSVTKIPLTDMIIF